MSVLTRIKNNQITDSTIWANAKIIPGSIVGSLFSSNITVTSDFTITGNLTVQGSSTYLTVASTNTYVNDPLIVLNNAFSGANSYDLGFVFNRGSSPNKAFYWDESSGEFRLITTTETGTTYGSIAAETNFEKLRLGNLVAQYDVSTITLTATGLINTTGNISGAVVNGGAINSTGLINTTGNVSAAVHTGGAVTVTGLINTTGNVSAATVIAGQFNTTGNLSASQVSTATLNATGLINTLGNISASVLNSGAINSTGLINTTGNVSAATIIAGQFNTTGNLSATEVSTQTLKSSALTSGRVVFTGTDGLLVSNAGITFSANTLTVGGALPITINGTTATIATTTANQNLILAPNGGGNVSVNNRYIINVADPINGQDAVTLSYLNSQISSGVTNIQLDDTDITITDPGTPGLITANVDNIAVFEITSELTNFDRDVKVANTTVSTTTTSGALKVSGGVGVVGNITVGGRFKSTDDTQSSSATTGAIITAGGAGIAKDLWVGGGAWIQGNLTVQGRLTAIQSTTLDVTDVQLTLAKGAGSSAAADGAGINVDYGNVGANITYTHATTSWNFNRAVIGSSYANFTGNVLGQGFIGQSLNVSGNVLAASAVLGTLTVNGTVTNQGVNAAGNILAQGGIFNALTVNGLLATTGNVIGGLGQFAAINATPIGNAVPSTGVFTTATAGAVNAPFIGNTGAVFNGTTLNVTGNVVAATVLAQLVTSDDATFGNVAAGFIGNTATAYTGASINLSGNVLAAGGIFNSLTVNGTSSATTFSGAGTNLTGTASSLSIGGSAPAGSLTGSTLASGVTASSLTSVGTLTGLTVSGDTSITSATDTTSLSDGALKVTGGTAVGKTLWVGEGAVINSTRAAEAFQVYGATGNNGLIYTNTAKNAIVFSSTGNVTVQDGVIVKFDSTGAILLPRGANADRPAAAGNVDIGGMLRFNTGSNALEYYDGAAWTAPGATFTIISTNAFSGNGVQTVFTLSSSSTTAGTIVAVNGVVQIPTTAYSVSGTSLTFTEAPATGDSIDARVLTTTSTVSQLSNGSSSTVFDAQDYFANIKTNNTVALSINQENVVTFTNDVIINGNLTVKGGSSGNINIGDQSTDKVQLQGTIVYNQTAISAPGTNLKQLDTFGTSAYSTAKYLIQVKDASVIESAEVLLAQDTTNVQITTFAVNSTHPGGALGTFSANIVSGSAYLWYTPVSGRSFNANIKIQTTYIV